MNFKIHYWPGFLALWLSATFLISYIVAVRNGNVVSFVPYISELGAWYPSSCVFGQFMNIAALICFIIIYLRYRQIELAINTNTTKLNKIWNKIAVCLGIVLCLGMSFVANFQGNVEGNRKILIMHLIGSVMAFGIGSIYLVIQLVKITFALRPYYEKYPEFGVSKFTQYFRLILLLIFYINLAIILPFALAAPSENNGYRIQGLLPEDDGYNVHLVSVIAEWNVLITFIMILLTITNELKALSFEGIRFKQI